MLGAAQAVEICNDLTARFGARFAPPKGLCDMAKQGAKNGGAVLSALTPFCRFFNLGDFIAKDIGGNIAPFNPIVCV